MNKNGPLSATKAVSETPASVAFRLQRSCECGQHTGGGECEECKKKETLQRHASSSSGPVTGSVGPAVTQTLSRAAAEGSHPIHEPLRTSLGEQLGHDFSHVRVHGGADSAEAAKQIGARAYTLGTDIHLGKESHELARRAFDRLIAHETIHTVQQGSKPVAPTAGMKVSDPHDAAEKEADGMAESVVGQLTPGASRSLALRDQMRASMFGAGIARSVGPQIQRDLTGKYPTAGGDFTMDMKTVSKPGDQSGLDGTIKFKANDKGPDSPSIWLLQVAKTVDMSTGKDSVWTGDEANRNKAMTAASPGVEKGFFVDQMYGELKRRTKKKDKSASPFYIDTGHLDPATNKDGSKKGNVIAEASLSDTPGSSSNMSFSFETVAKDADPHGTGHVYGTIMWGFEVTDAVKGKVEKERAVGRDVTLKSTDKAIEAFNKFFRNPGAPTAPKK
ncbi:MAG: DUF4157 domain-containing protein [Candidatus Sulfotelmatobacter sp.]